MKVFKLLCFTLLSSCIALKSNDPNASNLMESSFEVTALPITFNQPFDEPTIKWEDFTQRYIYPKDKAFLLNQNYLYPLPDGSFTDYRWEYQHPWIHSESLLQSFKVLRKPTGTDNATLMVNSICANENNGGLRYFPEMNPNAYPAYTPYYYFNEDFDEDDYSQQWIIESPLEYNIPFPEGKQSYLDRFFYLDSLHEPLSDFSFDQFHQMSNDATTKFDKDLVLNTAYDCASRGDLTFFPNGYKKIPSGKNGKIIYVYYKGLATDITPSEFRGGISQKSAKERIIRLRREEWDMILRVKSNEIKPKGFDWSEVFDWELNKDTLQYARRLLTFSKQSSGAKKGYSFGTSLIDSSRFANSEYPAKGLKQNFGLLFLKRDSKALNKNLRSEELTISNFQFNLHKEIEKVGEYKIYQTIDSLNYGRSTITEREYLVSRSNGEMFASLNRKVLTGSSVNEDTLALVTVKHVFQEKLNKHFQPIQYRTIANIIDANINSDSIDLQILQSLFETDTVVWNAEAKFLQATKIKVGKIPIKNSDAHKNATIPIKKNYAFVWKNYARMKLFESSAVMGDPRYNYYTALVELNEGGKLTRQKFKYSKAEAHLELIESLMETDTSSSGLLKFTGNTNAYGKFGDLPKDLHLMKFEHDFSSGVLSSCRINSRFKRFDEGTCTLEIWRTDDQGRVHQTLGSPDSTMLKIDRKIIENILSFQNGLLSQIECFDENDSLLEKYSLKYDKSLHLKSLRLESNYRRINKTNVISKDHNGNLISTKEQTRARSLEFCLPKHLLLRDKCFQELPFYPCWPVAMRGAKSWYRQSAKDESLRGERRGLINNAYELTPLNSAESYSPPAQLNFEYERNIWDHIIYDDDRLTLTSLDLPWMSRQWIIEAEDTDSKPTVLGPFWKGGDFINVDKVVVNINWEQTESGEYHFEVTKEYPNCLDKQLIKFDHTGVPLSRSRYFNNTKLFDLEYVTKGSRIDGFKIRTRKIIDLYSAEHIAETNPVGSSDKYSEGKLRIKNSQLAHFEHGWEDYAYYTEYDDRGVPLLFHNKMVSLKNNHHLLNNRKDFYEAWPTEKQYRFIYHMYFTEEERQLLQEGVKRFKSAGICDLRKNNLKYLRGMNKNLLTLPCYVPEGLWWKYINFSQDIDSIALAEFGHPESFIEQYSYTLQKRDGTSE